MKNQLHFHSLKRLCWQSLIAYLGLFILCYHYHARLISVLLSPLNQHPPIISQQILAPLTIPIQVSFDLSLLLSLPFVLLQIWRFIQPGLYPHEKRLIASAIISSGLFFLMGTYFCWQIICPFILNLLQETPISGIIWMPSFQSIYDFILSLLLFFGFSFQLPLILLLLEQLDLISLAQLKKYRSYALVSALTIGMLVTPPDVISQIIVALPLYLIYESSIFIIGLLRWRQKKRRQIASVPSFTELSRGKLQASNQDLT